MAYIGNVIPACGYCNLSYKNSKNLSCISENVACRFHWVLFHAAGTHLTSESNQNKLDKDFQTTWSIMYSLDNQLIKTGICVLLKLRPVPQIQANDVS